MPQHGRILLVGPNATLMGSVAARLEYEHHCTVVGAVATVDEAAAALAKIRADILLLDIDGIQVDWRDGLRGLRGDQPELRTILTCSVIDERCVEEIPALQISGILLKDEIPSRLGEAVREVLAGSVWFPPDLLERVVIDSNGFRQAPSSVDDAE